MPDVLVVCTANQARSPLLASLLQSHADSRLGPGVVTVGSAGVDARVGDPAADGSRRVARAYGLSLEEHRSMPIMAVPVVDTALVVTMTRRHRAEVARRRPELTERTFALRELVAALEGADPPDGPEAHASGARASARARIERVTALAHERRPRRGGRRLDVPDPIGADLDAYQAMGEELAAASELLADALFGSAPR